MSLIPAFDGRKRGMLEVFPQVAFDARHVREIGGLAVAPVQPGEYAEDFGRALRAHKRIRGGKIRHREVCIRLAARHRVVREQPQFEFVAHVDARVLQKRCYVVGGWPSTQS